MFDSIFFLTTEEFLALKLSIYVGLCSVVINFIPAIFFGYILARKEFFGKGFLNSIIHLPLILPPVVIGYILLVTFGSNGILGNYLEKYFNFTIAFTWKGAVIASAVTGFPLFVRAIRISVELVDKNLEKAALTLGSNSLKVFLTITLPLILPGILTGLLLNFARSLGEFGATITFVSNIPGETQTIPLAIYNYNQIPGSEIQILRLVLISIFISMISLIIGEFLNKKVSILNAK